MGRAGVRTSKASRLHLKDDSALRRKKTTIKPYIIAKRQRLAVNRVLTRIVENMRVNGHDFALGTRGPKPGAEFYGDIIHAKAKGTAFEISLVDSHNHGSEALRDRADLLEAIHLADEFSVRYNASLEQTVDFLTKQYERFHGGDDDPRNPVGVFIRGVKTKNGADLEISNLGNPYIFISGKNEFKNYATAEHNSELGGAGTIRLPFSTGKDKIHLNKGEKLIIVTDGFLEASKREHLDAKKIRDELRQRISDAAKKSVNWTTDKTVKTFNEILTNHLTKYDLKCPDDASVVVYQA